MMQSIDDNIFFLNNYIRWALPDELSWHEGRLNTPYRDILEIQVNRLAATNNDRLGEGLRNHVSVADFILKY